MKTGQQILADELQGLSEVASVNLPSMEHLRRTIRSQRHEHNNIPQPVHREDIPVLPLLYQQTSTGEPFLLYDSGIGDVNRIFIFATNQALDLLANSDDWFCDGTFKVCPEVFFQLYTVHAKANERIYPCAFALFANKTQATYSRFFRELSNAVLNIGTAPFTIMFDFEIAAINAAIAIFPNVEVSGCFLSFVGKHMETYSRIWVKRTLHQRPGIFYTYTHGGGYCLYSAK